MPCLSRARDWSLSSPDVASSGNVLVHLGKAVLEKITSRREATVVAPLLLPLFVKPPSSALDDISSSTDGPSLLSCAPAPNTFRSKNASKNRGPSRSVPGAVLASSGAPIPGTSVLDCRGGRFTDTGGFARNKPTNGGSSPAFAGQQSSALPRSELSSMPRNGFSMPVPQIVVTDYTSQGYSVNERDSTAWDAPQSDRAERFPGHASPRYDERSHRSAQLSDSLPSVSPVLGLPLTKGPRGHSKSPECDRCGYSSVLGLGMKHSCKYAVKGTRRSEVLQVTYGSQPGSSDGAFRATKNLNATSQDVFLLSPRGDYYYPV
ncbi:hypothetical protein NM688_g6223 [Phlebia brevispora]|uniref:Uncharacterized protein n=1 Tax=Phlebia brevispora TaxID=194682 RepID=A0ACC1SIJ7_9APHY|nr:hypothetical protein NM688_g6223 [Phlebia brevispora]